MYRSTNLVYEANVYLCYDYMHLDTLSDINVYRSVAKPQRTQMENANRAKDTHGLKSFILHALRKSLYIYDNEVNSMVNRKVTMRKL